MHVGVRSCQSTLIRAEFQPLSTSRSWQSGLTQRQDSVIPAQAGYQLAGYGPAWGQLGARLCGYEWSAMKFAIQAAVSIEKRFRSGTFR